MAAPGLVCALGGGGGREVSCCDVRGGRLLAAGGDRALRVWRWAAGAGWRLQAVAPRAHRYGVTAARWAPAGALAASGGVDGAVRVWAAADLAARRVLAAPGAGAVRALCWAGGARLLAGHDDGALRVWHVPRAALLARLRQHEGALHALATLAGGALVLAACTDGVLKVFDLQAVCRCAAAGEPEPAPLEWVDGAHDLGALCADVAPGGRDAATGGHDARIRLWHVGDGGRVRAGATLEGHGAAVTALRFAGDGGWAGAGGGGGVALASGALDRTARLWAVDGTCLAVLHAHDRYLTCVALDSDMRFLVTGSNDKTIRTWTLGKFTIDDTLDIPCDPRAHFGFGDLEGIEPLDTDELLAAEAATLEQGAGGGGGAARLAWRSLDAHAGAAVNCISIHEDLIATACSDGLLRVFRWDGAEGSRGEVCGGAGGAGGARRYPLLACEWGAGGRVLLAAGLDGTAALWDPQSECELRSVSLPAAAEGDSGGGGVRGARVAAGCPSRLLLATDDGRVALWGLTDDDPTPTHGHCGAATCCAWSGARGVVAAGGEGGELRLYGGGLLAAGGGLLAHHTDAHDLGVQSCDFADPDAVDLGDGVLLLASAGNDDFIKLWRIELDEAEECLQSGRLEECASARAHGGGAMSVRWRGARLASGGADGWARVWGARAAGPGGHVALVQLAAVPAKGGAVVPATVFLDDILLVLGSVSGELSVWRLPAGAGAEGSGVDAVEDGVEADTDEEADSEEDEDAGAEPRWWGAPGVDRWLRDYVTRVPGVPVSREREAAVRARARAARLTGARLLDEPIEQLLDILGCGEENAEGDAGEGSGEGKGEGEAEGSVLRAQLRLELGWLRRPRARLDPRRAPHGLLCPVSHGLQAAPARAADGCTYDRASLHEWFIAADGFVSAVSGRRLRNGRVLPDRRATLRLRGYLQQELQQQDLQQQELQQQQEGTLIDI